MKKVNIAFSDAAVADVIEQADWFEAQEGAALSHRWERAVTRTVLNIAGHPHAGVRCAFKSPELTDVRRVPIARFPRYLVFYQVHDGEVLILRIVHGARDLESLFSG